VAALFGYRVDFKAGRSAKEKPKAETTGDTQTDKADPYIEKRIGGCQSLTE
jgi:hypothetical protein